MKSLKQRERVCYSDFHTGGNFIDVEMHFTNNLNRKGVTSSCRLFQDVDSLCCKGCLLLVGNKITYISTHAICSGKRHSQFVPVANEIIVNVKIKKIALFDTQKSEKFYKSILREETLKFILRTCLSMLPR